MPLRIEGLERERRAGLYVLSFEERPLTQVSNGLFKIGKSMNLASRLNSYALSYPRGFQIYGLLFLKEKYDSFLDDRCKRLVKALVTVLEERSFQYLSQYAYKNNMRRGQTEWFLAPYATIVKAWQLVQRDFPYFVEQPLMSFDSELKLYPSPGDAVLRVRREVKQRPKKCRKRDKVLEQIGNSVNPLITPLSSQGQLFLLETALKFLG